MAAHTLPETVTLSIPAGGRTVEGDFARPEAAQGLVIFAHGSGSSRHSSRNRKVARVLQEAGFATLLMDLLTRDEERYDMVTARLRFDIGLLAGRLEEALGWMSRLPAAAGLRAGLFGASTGAAAALIAAADLPQSVGAVVSRGGRPDLADRSLPLVEAPVLLIVGGADTEVLELNRAAYARLPRIKSLEVVPGATHLFEEEGALEQVAALAASWFRQHLREKPETSRPQRPTGWP